MELEIIILGEISQDRMFSVLCGIQVQEREKQE
jgi:hypothetical protein